MKSEAFYTCEDFLKKIAELNDLRSDFVYRIDYDYDLNSFFYVVEWGI